MGHASSIPDRTHPSSFDVLLHAALRDYEKQTGTTLSGHPFAEKLKECDSVDSMASVLQDHAQGFLKFRGEDGKIVNILKGTVQVLSTLSHTVLSESVSLAFPPAKFIFAVFGVLLDATKDVSASYDALVDLFESIESFLGRLDIYTKVTLTEAMRHVIVKILVEVLSTLALATKQVKRGRLKKFVTKIFGENEIEDTLQRLDRLTQDEALATEAQTLEAVHNLTQHRKAVMEGDTESGDGLRKTIGLVQEISGDIDKSQCDELRQSIRKWLSPPDPWKNHNLARRSRHKGTATWWINCKTFSEWKHSCPGSLLLILGKPGAGKSVLSSAIIQDIRETEPASLAFFYCDFREDKKKKMRGLLSSLLIQLCDQSDAYYGELTKFYSDNRSGEHHASDSELLQCLLRMLGLPGQATTYIIIDALDECPTSGLPSPRESVVELVVKLVGLRAPNLRICVTSRPEVEVEPTLEPIASHSVFLHRESGQLQDITEYVKHTVNTDRKMRIWKSEDRELVIEVLTKSVDGMFRWAFCQLEYLRHCLRQHIPRALKELPETLDETYDLTLQHIDKHNWEYAHRLFQCVAASSRPLRVEELAEFLAIDYDAESTPMPREDWRQENPVHAVQSICSSLLAIVDVDGTRVIQFAHLSVKEYLTSKRLADAKPTLSRFHVSMTQAHTIVAQACLGVLLHIDESITEDGVKKLPLAEYAAEHWVAHARFDGVSPNIQNGTKRLFDPKNHHLSVWVWVFDPASPKGRYMRSGRPSQVRGTALHYAAFCGIQGVVKFLVVECSQDVNARSFDGNETPLTVASREGHSEVVQALLEHGADMGARDNYSYSPLEHASTGDM